MKSEESHSTEEQDTNNKDTDSGTSGVSVNKDSETEDTTDVYEEDEAKPGKFDEVFSDTDSENRFV